jgi:hypothetical protein
MSDDILALSEDRGPGVTYQWLPDQLDDISFEQVVNANRPIRVSLWRTEAGALNLSIFAVQAERPAAPPGPDRT